MRTVMRVVLIIPILTLTTALGLAQEQLLSTYVEGVIPLDPSAQLWAKAPSVEVPLLPQVIARPFNLTPSIPSLSVRSVHNGVQIAFLLTWKDATKDAIMRTDTFRDAVAVMVPVKEKTAITMGMPGGRVLILHWKADWQEDMDKAFVDIATLYPNFWIDWYPFVPSEHPYDIRSWTNPEARRYLTGWVLGNPRSQPEKRTPVEEQVAEGFGTLTTNWKQSTDGRGVYQEGTWKVVITRPFVVGDPNDPVWGPGKQTAVAFAAWDGGKGEIGSRKGFSDWVTLEIEPVRR